MSTVTPNLGLTLPTPNVDTGWGGTLNTDFTTIDNIFAATGLGTAVGLNVGSGKVITVGGTMILGTGDNSGSVAAPVIRGAARTGTNVVGADITIDAANGTGTGGSGSIKFRTAPPASSGTTPNVMATVLEVKADGTVTVNGVSITSVFSPGMMMDWAGGTAPAGWRLCAGQSLATVGTYAALFAAIGYTYGGSGANFNVPDFRGRVGAGRDDMGGTPANRITAAESGIVGTNLGASGGLEYHQLSVGQLAKHQHFEFANETGAGSALGAGTYVQRAHNYSTNDDYIMRGSATAATQGLSSISGNDDHHNNVQPTLIVNKIIKY